MWEPVLSPDVRTLLLLAAGTLVTEDLTSIGAGVLVANGRVDFVHATVACFAGIYVGDLLLFFAGRRLGRRLFSARITRRFLTPDSLDRSAAWLERRGAVAIVFTRLLPGTRLPTYLAAGALGVCPWKFAAWFAVAAAVWTPLLIGVSSAFGAEFARRAVAAGANLAQTGLAATAAVWLFLAAVRRAFSWRARRILYGLWRRWTRWEFWPLWLFYPPVLAWIVFLMCRHRSATLFTAANPGIVGGGVVGESKFQILRGLARSGRVARAALLPGDLPAHYRQNIARLFMRSASRPYPVVLKPDQGQRGSGVTIVHDAASLAAHIERSPVDLILQEYVAGPEFGIFYVRLPGEAQGQIFSLTRKHFPSVVGDGRRSLEELVLEDSRAVCYAALLARTHAPRWRQVPAAGERVPLVEIGSHCRGTMFLDGRHLVTPALEAAVDSTARCFDGFYFGRFDVRAPSVEALRRGEFTILELNGVTSEAAHIYDPASGLCAAYRVLFEQWRLAFAVGRENVRRGAATVSLRTLLELSWRYRQTSRRHPSVAPGVT